MRAGSHIPKATQRALYRRNVDHDTVDEYCDRNIFNRGFKRTEKVWAPNGNTKKGIQGCVGVQPEHMSPAVVEKKKRESKGVWKYNGYNNVARPTPPIIR